MHRAPSETRTLRGSANVVWSKCCTAVYHYYVKQRFIALLWIPFTPVGMTVLTVSPELSGFHKIDMTALSCITGLDNQSIARTRSLTSISWWIVLFRLIASSLTRCAEICQAGRQENAKEPKIPSLRHSPHSGIGLKRSPKPKSDVESTGTKIRIDAIAPISRRMQ